MPSLILGWLFFSNTIYRCGIGYKRRNTFPGRGLPYRRLLLLLGKASEAKRQEIVRPMSIFWRR
jgi:hypothetical protein